MCWRAMSGYRVNPAALGFTTAVRVEECLLKWTGVQPQ